MYSYSVVTFLGYAVAEELSNVCGVKVASLLW